MIRPRKLGYLGLGLLGAAALLPGGREVSAALAPPPKPGSPEARQVAVAAAVAKAQAGKAVVRIPSTGILAGSDIEYEVVRAQMKSTHVEAYGGFRFVVGNLGKRRTILAVCGNGSLNAGVVTAILIDHFRPAEIVLTGGAGVLNPALQPGDVIIAEKVGFHDQGFALPGGIKVAPATNPVTGAHNPLYFPANERLLKAAGRVAVLTTYQTGGRRAPRFLRGTIVTGDAFVASADRRSELYRTLRADAVELETAAVAQVCWQQKVPFLAIRSLTHRADESAAEDFRTYGHYGAAVSANFALNLVSALTSTAKN